MDTYGKRLRAARESARVSVRQLAGKVGCSPTHISDIELDRRGPSEDLEDAICYHLGIKSSTLGERPADLMRRLRARMADPGFAERVSRLLKEAAA